MASVLLGLRVGIHRWFAWGRRRNLGSAALFAGIVGAFAGAACSEDEPAKKAAAPPDQGEAGSDAGVPNAGKGGSGMMPVKSVTVSPTMIELAPGDEQTFTSTVVGSDDLSVTWSVTEDDGGSITASGRYTAPAETGTFHVVATSSATGAEGTAVVTVTSSPMLTLSPASPSVVVEKTVEFSVTPDVPVDWSVDEATGCGTIDDTGVYTAPADPRTCHVTATAQADSEQQGHASVTITAAPAATLEIFPARGIAVVGGVVNFTVSPKEPVEFAVDEASGCGSVTSEGVYTAPEEPATCHVTAALQSDESVKARAEIEVVVDKIGTWINITPAELWANLNPPTPPPANGGGNYGMMSFGLSVSQPEILYAGTAYSGMWKSLDSGDTWAKINTGRNADSIDHGGSPTIAIDQTNPDVIYTAALFSSGQGIWKSTDGGVNWDQMLSGDALTETSADIYCIQLDPHDPAHVLVAFHSGWAGSGDAGVLESKNGGVDWIQHPPKVGWGNGHNIFFLGQDDDGEDSSDAWILATQSDGYWRTMDGGATWTQVSTYDMQHGATNVYRASTGVLYMGTVSHIVRSSDNGRTWEDTGAPTNQDGYNTVLGDGLRMYAQTANTGYNSTGTNAGGGRYWTSLETDGLEWTQYNDQTFTNGPYYMAYDPKNKIMYSSNWDAGLWRLATGK